MKGYSKREVLEIFDNELEKFMARFLFLCPATNWSIVYDF